MALELWCSGERELRRDRRLQQQTQVTILLFPSTDLTEQETSGSQ